MTSWIILICSFEGDLVHQSIWTKYPYLSQDVVFLNKHVIIRAVNSVKTATKCSYWNMYVPANTTYWNNGGLMLVQRRRRWPSMKTTLGQHHGGKPCHVSSYSHHVTLAHCSSKSAGRVDFFGDKHCSQKLRNRLLSSSESKNMIPCR